MQARTPFEHDDTLFEIGGEAVARKGADIHPAIDRTLAGRGSGLEVDVDVAGLDPVAIGRLEQNLAVDRDLLIVHVVAALAGIDSSGPVLELDPRGKRLQPHHRIARRDLYRRGGVEDERLAFRILAAIGGRGDTHPFAGEIDPVLRQYEADVAADRQRCKGQQDDEDSDRRREDQAQDRDHAIVTAATRRPDLASAARLVR